MGEDTHKKMKHVISILCSMRSKSPAVEGSDRKDRSSLRNLQSHGMHFLLGRKGVQSLKSKCQTRLSGSSASCNVTGQRILKLSRHITRPSKEVVHLCLGSPSSREERTFESIQRVKQERTLGGRLETGGFRG